jgi:Rod binding domain-containing protein
MDDKIADQLVAGKGLGFGNKMAEQLIQQIKAKNINESTTNAVNNSLASSSAVNQ